MTIPRLGKINLTLAGSAMLLVGMGLYALWSYDQQGHAYFKRQLVWSAVGAAVIVATMIPHYRATRHAAYPAYALALLALVALLVFGRYTRGARGWFAIGPVNVQPAELAKIAVVLAAARWLSMAKDLDTWRGLLVPGLLVIVPTALILMQPDLGNAMLFVPALLVMLYVAGARPKHLAVILTVILLAAPVAYRFGLKEYQRNRLTAFLWPDKVPKDLSYQQMLSVKAAAAGRTAGSDGGDYYVPDRHTDFVFSILAEETGFLGSSFLLLLFALFFAQAAWIASQSRDPYARLTAVGLLTFLALQVFVNIGMAVGVAPITGLTLPFVSYGGSSMVSCCLAVGLILNVSARRVPTFSRRDLDAGHLAIREFIPQPTKWLPG